METWTVEELVEWLRQFDETSCNDMNQLKDVIADKLAALAARLAQAEALAEIGLADVACGTLDREMDALQASGGDITALNAKWNAENERRHALIDALLAQREGGAA